MSHAKQLLQAQQGKAGWLQYFKTHKGRKQQQGKQETLEACDRVINRLKDLV